MPYECEDLARILLLHIRTVGFMLQLGERPIVDSEDMEAVTALSTMISQHTTHETRQVYNGRLCQHVFCSAKRCLDRRTSAAIRELGLVAADPREIERHGLITNTLSYDDIASGLRLLEAKARASHPGQAQAAYGGSGGGSALSPARQGDCVVHNIDEVPARVMNAPPRGVPIQTVFINVDPAGGPAPFYSTAAVNPMEASVDTSMES